MLYYFYEFIQATYRPRIRAQPAAQEAADNNDVNQVTSQLQSLAVDNDNDSEIVAVDNDSETETVDNDYEIEAVDDYICDSEIEAVRKYIYDRAIESSKPPIFYNLTGDIIAMRDFDLNTYLKILKRHDDWIMLRKMQQNSYICQCHNLRHTRYECIHEMIWKSWQNLLILNSAVHLPEAIDRDLFKVFDTKSYQTYLFLKSTGIAHTVCNKTKKVICISCKKKKCEGVIKLKASIKASQEASLKEVGSEGSTQQIEEAENADKQKLAGDLIKPNYHINIPYDPIAKKKSRDLLDSGFYYTVHHFIPPYKKGEKCKSENSNEYSDADSIE